MREIIALGNRIYHHRDHTDFNLQRLFVFWVRALNSSQMVLQLKDFFAAFSDLQKLESGNAIFYEQLLRHVFYHNSTLKERRQLIEDHFSFCQQHFFFPVLQTIYYDGRLVLWQGSFAGGKLNFGLDFFYVDRKEGLMTLDLMLDGARVYHITFFVGRYGRRTALSAYWRAAGQQGRRRYDSSSDQGVFRLSYEKSHAVRHSTAGAGTGTGAYLCREQ